MRGSVKNLQIQFVRFTASCFWRLSVYHNICPRVMQIFCFQFRMYDVKMWKMFRMNNGTENIRGRFFDRYAWDMQSPRKRAAVHTIAVWLHLPSTRLRAVFLLFKHSNHLNLPDVRKYGWRAPVGSKPNHVSHPSVFRKVYTIVGQIVTSFPSRPAFRFLSSIFTLHTISK